jgi:hypothetical protein
LTQQQLAGELTKPQSFVAKVELGERRLDVIEFLTVCEALGINPCDLLAQLDRRKYCAGCKDTGCYSDGVKESS